MNLNLLPLEISSSSLLAAAAEAESVQENAPILGLSLIIAIFLASIIFSELLARLKLPSILGDLLAGVIVGSSVLHLVILSGNPDLINLNFIQALESLSGASYERLVVQYQTDFLPTLNSLGELGLLCLLFLTGLESDLQEMLRVATQATTVAITGVILPFALGTAGAIAFFHLPILPAVFAGAALTATSIGITAKVLQEIGQLKSKEGQIIIGAAVLDDILGIIILAVVISLVEEGNVQLSSILALIASATLFVGGALLLSKYCAPVFEALFDRLQVPGSFFVVAFIFLCLLSLIADALKLEAVLGAFAAGLVLGGTKRGKELEEQIQPFVTIFATIFFISIGAQADLSVLNPAIPDNRAGLLVAVFLILVAIVGKLIAGFLVFGQPGVNRLAIGTGMIPRGEVGLVFVGLGSSTGIVSKSLEVALILMVIATTFLAPPLLRLVFNSRYCNLPFDS